MNVVKLWLKWFFVPCGVVFREEKGGRLSWFEAFKRLFTGGIRRGSPTGLDLAKWLALRRPLKRYKCNTCDVYFWAWKKSDYCGSFACLRELK